MGGTALQRPARRLTTLQYESFTLHCTKALAPLFPSFHRFRYAHEKETHGDLDLICSHPPFVLGESVKGGDGGILHDDGTDTGKWMRGAKADKEGMREFCISITKALKGIEWVRGGWQISVAIPCNKLEGLGELLLAPDDEKGQPFYQVDLILLPPPTIPFILLSTSYATSLIILSTALRAASSTLMLHMTHLSIKYSPYLGLPPIDILLTCSPTEFCGYVGLDYPAWQREVFAVEKDLWKWLTNVEDNTLLAQGFKQLVKLPQRPKTVKHHNEVKIAGYDSFRNWLASSAESKFRVADDSVRAETPLTIPSSSNKGSPATKAIDSTPRASPDESQQWATPTAIIVLDAEQPAPMDEYGVAAATHWGKYKEFTSLMDVRRKAARVLGAQQKKRAEAREKAEKELQATMSNVSLTQ